jgi:hypothetical protein
MSHIKTLPNPYIPYHTYIPCRHDFTDLDEAIDSALDKGTQPIDSYVENLKNNFEKMNKFENLAVHLHGLLTTKLSSIVGTE